MSRAGYPKQLLQLRGSNTLLQETVLRLNGLERSATAGMNVAVAAPIIVCAEEHRFLIAEQLEQIDCKNARIVLEPVGRNTAPALTVAALAAMTNDVDPLLLVMPADHAIGDRNAFHRAVLRSVAYAQAGALVSFGIEPRSPETGYGYIKMGVPAQLDAGSGGCMLENFVEKPDRATAESYLADGQYLWNSGMFMMRASVWLETVQHYQPDILRATRKAFDDGVEDGEFFWLHKPSFELCPSDSIDYAVMERLSADTELPLRSGNDKQKTAAVVIPLDAAWSDLGSWSSLLELSEGDAYGNVVMGDVYTDGTHGSVLFAQNRFVAALGLEGVVIVETPDAVLVAHKDCSQEVRGVVDWLNSGARTEGKMHWQSHHHWGCREMLNTGALHQVHRLTVKPGCAVDLQTQRQCAAHWVVLRGTAKIVRDGEEFLLAENQSVSFPPGVPHRLENPNTSLLEVIEVQSGSSGADDAEGIDRLLSCGSR